MRSTASVREIQRKLRVLEHAQMTGNVCQTCRYFGIGRASFYRWKAAFDEFGLAGLAPKPPIARRHPRQIHPEIEENVLHLRRTYHLGPIRIVWYLERYHGIRICDASVSRILKRLGLNRLPGRVGRRAVPTKRYAKKVPGHHIQVDVKFLAFKRKDDRQIRRFQYTAIDDATRVRALRIYSRHNQKNAMDFIDHVIDKFPFRIHTVRTDRGHEFQAKFHWHVEDQGIRHAYVKPRSPQLNGKVERSHRSDQEEFYPLLTSRGDVDLGRKLAQWERFYNYDRPHGAFHGRHPMKLFANC